MTYTRVTRKFYFAHNGMWETGSYMGTDSIGVMSLTLTDYRARLLVDYPGTVEVVS